MSNSRKRVACHANCSGAHPDEGKRFTSRCLRRKAKAALLDADDPGHVDDPRDRNRGKVGSRDRDWGLRYFGDGTAHYWRLPKLTNRTDEDYAAFVARMRRK